MLLVTGERLSPGLGNPGYAYIDIRNFVPGGIVGDAGLGQVKDALENPDCIGGGGTVNAIGCDGGNGRIISCNTVQLILQLANLVAGGTDAERISGVGGRNPRNEVGRVDIHIIAKVIPYNLDGRVSLISQIFGSPLTKSRAGHPLAVAVGGKDRLSDTGAGQVVGKDGVNQVIDILIDVSSVDPLLVVGGGGSDGEVVALVAVQ